MSALVVHNFRTADGQKSYYPTAVQMLLTYAGYGMPPVKPVTRRGYKQVGETRLDYLLDPRTITVEIAREPACSLVQYWQERAALLDFFRPNRGGALVMTVTLPDGAQRALEVWYESGLEYAFDASELANAQVSARVSFVAHNPLWFDPNTVHVEPGMGSGAHLVFPFSIPSRFEQAGGQFNTNTITYLGTWPASPKLTLHGPYNIALIEHVTLGKKIQLGHPIADGEKRVIDLTPGRISVSDGNGVSRFGELSAASELVDFALYPAPTLANGQQQVIAYLDGATANSRFILSYNPQYMGI